jgi:periplasmic divalent cation tolerance protein
MNETSALLVMTTTDSAEAAERIAQVLIERELAACVQVLPTMISIYRWQGRSERASETLLLIKSTQSLFPQLAAAIQENHPYETPEIIGIAINTGSESYLKWLNESLSSG